MNTYGSVTTFHRDKNNFKKMKQFNQKKTKQSFISSKKSISTLLKPIMVMLLIVQIECSDIVTLQSERDIYCISDDLLTHPVTLNPPMKQETKTTTRIEKDFINDDWTKTNVPLVLNVPITDKRWEGYRIEELDLYSRSNETSSFSFSVYLSAKLEMFFDDDYLLKYYYIYKKLFDTWVHYTITPKEDTVIILDEEKVSKQIDIKPINFNLKSVSPTYWKRHNETIREATTITQNTPSKLIVPPTGKSCLLLYTLLEKNSYLQVSITSNGSKEIVLKPLQNLTVAKKWQFEKIIIDPAKETTIEFYRKSSSNSTKGYWAIDVHFCGDNIEHFTIPEDENATLARTCQILKPEHNIALSKDSGFFNCTPGYLGKNCEISCKKVLGEEYSMCETYRIYMNSTHSECSWGYTGHLCNQKCDLGWWGISCKEECDPTWDRCDFKIGRSSNVSSDLKLLLILGIIIIIIMAVLVVSFFIFCKLRNRQTKDAKDTETETLTTKP